MERKEEDAEMKRKEVYQSQIASDGGSSCDVADTRSDGEQPSDDDASLKKPPITFHALCNNPFAFLPVYIDFFLSTAFDPRSALTAAILTVLSCEARDAR
jgi:hypothetical protein